MKRHNHSVRTIVCLVGIAICLVNLLGCKRKNQPEDPYLNVPVNPLFATDPPIATDIHFTEITPNDTTGNLLFEATLPKQKINSDVLALMVGDSTKIVLHDDGINGDRLAADGIYSTVLSVDVDSLQLFMQQQAGEAKKLIGQNNDQLFEFKGRLEFPVSRAKMASLRSFSEVGQQKTDFKKRISVINPALIRLLLPVPEAFKHTALTVTDPSVITDPSKTFNPCTNTGTVGGAWTFGKLMRDMSNTAPGHTPESFLLNWLTTWTNDQTVNGDVINQRDNINNIINTWHSLCGGPAAPLDVNKAPFKLLAIVNRFDLRSGGAYGGGDAGEGRFVFCAMDANCNLQRFFVIFEYGVNKKNCASIHKYAQDWVDLASMPFPSAAYNDALKAITDQFAAAGTNPSKPNRSSLNQLRTNEISLGPLWELREFNISATTNELVNVSTKREPQIPFNSQGGSSDIAKEEAFGEFVNANAPAVIADKMEIPDNVSVSGVNTAFIAGKAHTFDPITFHWDGVVAPGTGHILNDTARFHISLNTCSGCHGGETHTGNFTHIGLPATPGGPAKLSSFLTGSPAFSGLPFIVSDRAERPSAATPIQWPFNDLEFRGRRLLDFVSGSCPHRIRVPLLAHQRVPVDIPIELIRQLTFERNTMSH